MGDIIVLGRSALATGFKGAAQFDREADNKGRSLRRFEAEPQAAVGKR